MPHPAQRVLDTVFARSGFPVTVYPVAGTPSSVLGLPDGALEGGGVFDAPVTLDAMIVNVRRTEWAQPVEGDLLDVNIDGTVHRRMVKGDPEHPASDALRLVWRIEAAEAPA